MENILGSKGVRRFFYAFLMSIACQVAVIQSASAAVYQLPGLRASDPTDYGPVFLHDTKITYRSKLFGGSQLTARTWKDNASFVMGGTNYAVSDSTYLLHADFDNSGNFLSGTVNIFGAISDMGINSTSLLATMDLVDFAFTGSLIGFNTDNLVCPLFDFCTTSESVYLTDFGGGFDINKKFWRVDGLAVTTVPVPAAAWLFGSALLGLVGLRRRRAH